MGMNEEPTMAEVLQKIRQICAEQPSEKPKPKPRPIPAWIERAIRE